MWFAITSTNCNDVRVYYFLPGIEDMSPRSSQCQSLLIFTLYCLIGAPCSLIDSHLPQVLAFNGVSVSIVGFAYLIYLPFNFRFIFAMVLDINRQHHASRYLLPLLYLSAFVLFIASLFPIGIGISTDTSKFSFNITVVYSIMGLLMLLLSMADPALDALIIKPEKQIENESKHDSFENSLQVIAFKTVRYIISYTILR